MIVRYVLDRETGEEIDVIEKETEEECEIEFYKNYTENYILSA